MNIKQKLKDFFYKIFIFKGEYPSFLVRTIASTIDGIIVLIARAIIATGFSHFWLKNSLDNFFNDFYDKFGTKTPKFGHKDHFDFIINHQIADQVFLLILILILIGALYYAILHSSALESTIGKKIFDIILVKEKNKKRIGFLRGLSHYLLSIFPVIFLSYLALIMVRYKKNLFEAATFCTPNLILSFIFLFWHYPQLFTNQKRTMYDLVAGVVNIKKIK